MFFADFHMVNNQGQVVHHSSYFIFNLFNVYNHPVANFTILIVILQTYLNKAVPLEDLRYDLA